MSLIRRVAHAANTWSRVFSVAGLLVAAAACPSSLSAQADRVPVRLTHLELDIAVHYGKGTIDGTARLDVENAGAEPVLRVPVQVHRLMEITRVWDGAAHPLALSQSLVSFVDQPQKQVRQAWIELDRPLAPGARTEIHVAWNGFLWGYTETGSRYIRDQVDSAFTILREDALAFPSLAVPSWRANRAAPRSDFTFRAHVRVPRGQVVAAGGALLDRIERDSLVTWTYKSTLPVPFLNITIAPYAVLEGGGVRVHFFPGDSAGARMVMDAITGAVARMTQWFGPLGNDLHLSVMEIPDGFGSQASLGAGIIQQAAAFTDRDQLRQLYHELSHLWNAPDTDRPSPRWNEGLATFLEHRLAAELDGGTGMDDYVDRVVAWFMPRFERDSTNRETPFIAYGRSGKTDLSYTVGFLMFSALHDVLGPETFNRAIGRWYQDRKDRGGTTDEFVAHVKRVGGPALDTLFDDWMFTTGWYERLKAGETLRQMAQRYRERR